MSAPPGGDVAGLARALRDLGYPCAVEPRAFLALLVMQAGDAARLASPSQRTAVLALAREHGFTHLAVEVSPEPSETRAPVLRD